MKKCLIILFCVGMPFFSISQKTDQAIIVREKNGIIKSVEFPLDLKTGVPENAQKFFEEFISSNPEDVFSKTSQEVESNGFIHQHYDQFYKGIKVCGAGYNIHLKNEKINFAHGHFIKIDNFRHNPINFFK